MACFVPVPVTRLKASNLSVMSFSASPVTPNLVFKSAIITPTSFTLAVTPPTSTSLIVLLNL